MKVESIDIPAIATSLATLLDRDIRHTKLIGLQAPEANAANILFGDKKVQPIELRPKANAALPITNFQEVFVRGTPPDKLSVVLFDG